MQFNILENEQYTIIQIQEARFDAKLTPSFHTELGKLKHNLREHLLLDMSGVRFMDSSGLGAVMGCYKMLRNTKISIINPQKPILDLLKLTRVDKLILSYSTIEDALAASA
ncbi:STAS domain-containing protein [uncultured Shewanella sp.]|uniref:STAS domain-containing protein n=1 Tax=uncultured Shewanella sp. TaxID=173975 RepID=UPI00262A90D7|nr:STAS domain-containing protein [uncultured Shewanella sp.]